ncbi:MAG: hypothetical protein A2Z06_04045 [Candidatus Glassbacteria bacterium RBG_16_58_8]|uniref:Uncharacterized protein n=1 Tax=Candidatus Glassbacteria bacterium RBG_16_58_8 TaxID=1817866 RepID=A0A1F5YCR1_9BACT|nr:MAG: hypothetical protein A2Z06_04045 [Candidatus Glassbacteria bacterium RBG_16_58_8]
MTEEKISLYEQGQLIVAAVRLLTHRDKKMPTASEISGLTGFPMEITLHLCHRLLDMGALHAVKGAFDDRYCVADHLKVEDLPRTVDPGEMVREIEKFRAERTGKQRKMEEMFSKKEFEREKDRHQKELEEKFKGFAGKKPSSPPDTLNHPPGKGEPTS